MGGLRLNPDERGGVELGLRIIGIDRLVFSDGTLQIYIYIYTYNIINHVLNTADILVVVVAIQRGQKRF